MKISILIPTCYRPELLKYMIRSMRETTSGFDIEPIFIVDKDIETLPVIETECRGISYILDFSETMRGALWSWNRALQLSMGNIIVPAGDDQLFHPRWLEYALESHRDHLDSYGVVGMNDLAYDGNLQLATMFLFDRGYCKDVMGGIFAPPNYKYFCVDSEWNEKAKSIGKFYWESRSIIEHLHVAHGKRDYDVHDKSKEENGWMEIDNRMFNYRKSNGFSIEWKSLI